jgi:hypothetical protein
MSDDIFANLPPKAEQLGEPLGQYRNRPGPFLVWSVAGVVLRAGCGAIFVWLALRPPEDPDEAAGVGALLLRVGLFVLGMFWLALAVRRARRARRGGNVRGVAAYRGGLVCVLDRGPVVAPWDDIDQVFDNGRRFRVRGGAEVTLPSSLEGWPTVAHLVLHQTFQRLIICASAMILGGRTVEFGPVHVNRDEITVGDRRVAWADVADVFAAWGRLRVLRESERVPALDVPLAEVPNLHAFAALVERLREGGFGSIVIGQNSSDAPESDPL